MQTVLVYFPGNPGLARTMQEGNIQFKLYGELDALRGASTSPLAIIVDIEQQPEPGLEALAALRQDFANCPLFAVASPEQHKAAQAIPVDGILSAPLNWQEVQQQMAALSPEQSQQPIAPVGDLDFSGMINILRHDLNSPGSTIYSGLELLYESIKDEELEAGDMYLNIIHGMLAAIKRHQFLIHDLLDWTQLAVHQLPVNLAPVSVPDIIQRVQTRHTAISPRQDVQVTWHVADNLPVLQSDPELLQRILISMLDMAAKFSPSNGTITVQVRDYSGGIEFSISDQGHPVDPALADHMFSPAVQDTARQQNNRSTVGAGLLFSQQAVEQMGGILTLESEDDTTFLTIWLPAA